jgi:hypothetical protein
LSAEGAALNRISKECRNILEHPEMTDLGAQLESTVNQPKLVRRSRSDMAVRLFYHHYPETLVGSKWLCVVIKYDQHDAFVITAYLTKQPKAGEDLWPTK